MVWSWSHSQQAYDNAEENVRKQSREWLETVYAEWEAKIPDSEDMNDKKYRKALKAAKKLADDTLADYIWEKMSQQALCENGGHQAWACPYGCGPHLVSFDYEDEDEDEEEEDDWFDDDDWPDDDDE